MLAREARGNRYRLVGIGISDLTDARADALDLADPRSLKRAKAERASDKARGRFGDSAVTTGRGARIRKERERD
jgi:DNA polymerase-4